MADRSLVGLWQALKTRVWVLECENPVNGW